MADPIREFEDLENAAYLVLIFGAIGVVGFLLYEVYQIGSSLPDAWTKLTDSIQGKIQDTMTSAGNAVGIGVDRAAWPGGYFFIGSSGTHWNCSGDPTDGNTDDQCTAGLCDDSNNCVYPPSGAITAGGIPLQDMP